MVVPEHNTIEPEQPLSGKFKAAEQALRSPRFREGLDRLRPLCWEPHPRTGEVGCLADHDYAALETLVRENAIQARTVEQAGRRPRARLNQESPTSDGLRFVREYMAGCRKLARHYLHHEAAAVLIHEELRKAGVLSNLASREDFPTATGARASSLAADITGAYWGAGPTSLAQARREWSQLRASDYERAYQAALSALRPTSPPDANGPPAPAET
jgi:hypothetical protein